MLILHVLAAATLVGGELLLFFAVTPATWIIEDELPVTLQLQLHKVIWPGVERGI